MSPDDYRGRKLRHRATGHEGVITTYATNIIGQVRFRIRYADGSVDHVSAGVIAASFDWTDEPVVGAAGQCRAIPRQAAVAGGADRSGFGRCGMTPEQDEAIWQAMQKADRIQRALRDCPELAELVRAAFGEGIMAGEDIGGDRAVYRRPDEPDSYWIGTETYRVLERALGIDLEKVLAKAGAQ